MSQEHVGHEAVRRFWEELDTEMYHQVSTFRDGKMVRFEYFSECGEALEAAGFGE
jgi:hypothetical protein